MHFTNTEIITVLKEVFWGLNWNLMILDKLTFGTVRETLHPFILLIKACASLGFSSRTAHGV
jgi:hypothetical protein